MQKTLFFSLRRRISIRQLLILSLLSLFVYTPVGASQERVATSDLKIKIVQIKDSGSSPYWSPDGKEIVYVDKGGLFVISSSGSGKERKIVSGRVREPRWSPDGIYIAYVDRKGLKIILPDKSGQPKLIYPDNDVQMPVWSPDSKWITFYLSNLKDHNGSGVYAVNIKTLKSKQLSYTGINPFWSGDGKSVFYFIDSEDGQSLGQLYFADLDGTNTEKLALIGAKCMNFNLEGNLLAYALKNDKSKAYGIYVTSPFKNVPPMRLTDDGYFPSFSFDNKWVSFFKYDSKIKDLKIFITPATGGDEIEVGAGIYSRWAFNKKELVYEVLGVKGGIYVARIYD